MIAIWVNLP